MDPELIAQLLAAQDATGAPPRAPQTGRGRTFLQLLRDGANAFGEATLGRALTLGTADPSLPETQEAYRSALGFTADFVPGVGDIKAVIHDAPALFAEGHPVLGTLAAASALPILGAPLDAARKTLRVRHHGPQVQDLDVLDPAFAGTGLRGSERQMQAAFPEEYEPGTYFYLGDQPAEPGLRGRPSVELDLPAEKFANPQQFQPFLEQAREQLVAEGRAVVPDLQFLRAQRLLKQSGEFEGYYDPQRGVLVKLTPTELPRGAANRAISEATSRNIPGSNTGGATFTLDGEDLLGTPNYAVAVRPGNDLTVPATADGGVARGDLNRFRERFSDDLTDPDHHVGTWRRDATPVEVAEGLAGPNGQVVDLDVVRAVPKREEGARWEAIRQGLQNEQKAIFDLENIEEIQLAPRDRTARQQAADRASRTSEANLAQRMDASQKKAFYSVLLATSGAALADHVFPELRENR